MSTQTCLATRCSSRKDMMNLLAGALEAGLDKYISLKYVKGLVQAKERQEQLERKRKAFASLDEEDLPPTKSSAVRTGSQRAPLKPPSKQPPVKPEKPKEQQARMIMMHFSQVLQERSQCLYHVQIAEERMFVVVTTAQTLMVYAEPATAIRIIRLVITCHYILQVSFHVTSVPEVLSQVILF